MMSLAFSRSLTYCEPIAERLGWVVVHSLWQFTLVALVACVLSLAMKRGAASTRYAALLVTMLMIVALPFVTWFALPSQDSPSTAAFESDNAGATRNQTTVEIPLPSSLDRDTSHPSAELGTESADSIDHVVSGELSSLASSVDRLWRRATECVRPWLSTIAAGWWAGILVLSWRPMASWWIIRRLRRVGVSAVSDGVRMRHGGLARRLGLRQAGDVLESTLVNVPVVVGYLRPVILLPVSLLTSLPPSQLEAILAHELAHVRRHDYLINALQTVVETVFFYHPVIWWLSNRIRIERENCCDDIAVAALGNRVAYGRALLALEDCRSTSTSLALSARDGSLLARVQRIVGFSLKDKSSGSALGGPWLLLLFAVSLLSVASVIAMSSHAQNSADESSDSAANILQEPESNPALDQGLQKESKRNGQPQWTVRGCVADGEGKPLSGVTVRAATGIGTLRGGGSGETNENGEYAFQFGQGIWMADDDVQLQIATISASKPGLFEKNLSRHGDLLMARRMPDTIDWGNYSKNDVILPDKSREVNFVMLPASQVEGTLVDGFNRPLGGYGVSLTGKELPPSSSVVVATKTDERGRFVLNDVPAGFHFQMLIEPAKREPPWNAWASGPLEFVAGDGEHQLHGRHDNKELVGRRFEVQVTSRGVGWKKALEIGRAHQRFDVDNASSVTPTNDEAAVIRLVLSPPSEPQEPPQQQPAGDDKAPSNDTVLKERATSAPQPTRESEPAFSARINARDGQSKRPVKSIRVIPTSYRDGATHVTWQSQYLKSYADSPATFEMERGWPQTQLRIEADGYRPFVTKPLPRETGLVVDVALEPDHGIAGRVVTPDGKPAAGARVAVCTWTNEVTVRNGTLTLGGHGERLRGIVTTAEDGSFRLPSEVDEWVLVVSHQYGYAEPTAAEFAANSTVTLEPWGRLEGEVMANGKPFVDQLINVGAGRGDVEVVLHYGGGEVRTDAEGKFVVEQLPPVKMYVSPFTENGDQQFNLLWFSGLVEIQPGRTTRLKLPRAGKPVTGRVVLPATSDLRFDDLEIDLSMTLRPPSVSGLRDQVDKSFAAYSEFMKSDLGAAFHREKIAVQPDGSFRVEGLPETNYVLNAYAYRRPRVDNATRSDAVGSYVSRVDVPAKGDDNGAVDLGELILRLRAND